MQTPFSPGDLVQTPQGKIGEVVECQKKDGDGGSVSDSSASEPTTSSGILPTNSEPTSMETNTAPPGNGAATILGDMPKAYCPRTHRIGSIIPGEPWEGRLWVLWQGMSEPEAVLRSTVWKAGDRFYDKQTGNPCRIIKLTPPDSAKVKWEHRDKESYISLCHLNLSPPVEKLEPEPEPEKTDTDIDKLVAQAQALLESAGYDWEVEELSTKFPELKIKAIADGKKVGDIHFFPVECCEEYYPNDCPVGGVWKNYFWAMSPELLDLDNLDNSFVREIEDIAISSMSLWQFVDLPFDDINFRHYVGRHLVKQKICHDYKIDEESLSLFVPHDSDMMEINAVIDSIMDEVNTYQRDIPAKGSDRLTQTELFPEWEEAS